jgi:hypothetical protein
MKNRNSIYATAYARKILGLSIKDINSLRVSKERKSRTKPIDKHGNYDGTDVGFTSNSIETTTKQKNTPGKQKEPKDHNSNYSGTDVGFTSKF